VYAERLCSSLSISVRTRCCISMCIGACISVCIGMWIGMWVSLCIGVCIGVCVLVCASVYASVCALVCTSVRVGSCIGGCIVCVLMGAFGMDIGVTRYPAFRRTNDQISCRFAKCPRILTLRLMLRKLLNIKLLYTFVQRRLCRLTLTQISEQQ